MNLSAVAFRGARGGQRQDVGEGTDAEAPDDEDEEESHGATALELSNPERLTRALWRVGHWNISAGGAVAIILVACPIPIGI